MCLSTAAGLVWFGWSMVSLSLNKLNQRLLSLLSPSNVCNVCMGWQKGPFVPHN